MFPLARSSIDFLKLVAHLTNGSEIGVESSSPSVIAFAKSSYDIWACP